MPQRPPTPPRTGRKRRDPAPDGERAIAQCARRLTAAIAEPDTTNVEELVEQIRDEATGNEAAGRRWIPAVRRVQAAGKIETDEADSIVYEIIMAIMSNAADRDAELGRLAEHLKPLHEQHEKNFAAYRAEKEKEKAGDGARLAEPVYPVGMQGLMDEYHARFYEMFDALVESFGESPMVRERRADDRAFLWRMIGGMQTLSRRNEGRTDSWQVTFTSPEDVPLPPMFKPAVEPDEQEYEQTLEERTVRWAAATSDEVDTWTVPVVAAFAAIESFKNEDGDGDLWIESVQTVRKAGFVDRDLSWLLLDRITEMMIPSEVDDPYQSDIMEQIWDIEYDHGEVDESDEESVRKAPEAWRVLNRAYNRRLTMLQVRILRAAGEDEMARMMEEEPDAFQRLVKQVAKIWEVDDEPGT